MREFLALVALGTLSCAGQSRPVTARVAPPVPVAPRVVEARVDVVVAGPPRPPCEVLKEIAEVARASFPSDQAPPEPEPCLEGKGGAYTLALGYVEDASSDYGPGFHGRAVLLHADAAGRVARSRAIDVSRTGTWATDYKLTGLADYDLDGTDELLVTVSEWAFESNGDYHAEIWRVSGERVEPYGPADKLSIARFEDVNRDGVPEVLLKTPFQGVINGCGADGTYIEFGPKWLMHAGPRGEFAFDDVSRAELLRACPKRPRPLVPRAAGGVDNTVLRERLACAVAWGVSSREIALELERDCPKLQVLNDECSFEGVLPVCVNVPQLVAWASKPPPFAL
jgi:hypothetical protein